MKDRCVFCQIATGETEAQVVHETTEVIAFLDHRPLFPGHVLLIPRDHVPTLSDLSDSLVAPLFSAAQRLAAAVEKATAAQGTFVAMNNRVSQSVPHLHVHIVPRTKGDGLRGFFWPRKPYQDDEHMRRVAAAIRKAVA